MYTLYMSDNQPQVEESAFAGGLTCQCRGCGEKIVYGLTAKNKKPTPLDSEPVRFFVPHKDAEVVAPAIIGDEPEKPVKRYVVWNDRLYLRDVYQHAPTCYDKDGCEIKPMYLPTWLTHFATCPVADQFRKTGKPAKKKSSKRKK